MSTRVEQVRKGFPAFAARDIDALEALMTPDVDILVASPALAGKPALVRQSRYRGHAGLRDCLGEIAEDYSELSLEARDFEELGDAVLVLGTLAYESANSGGGTTVGWVCRFDGDRLSRVETYWDWSEARSACLAGPGLTQAGA
jgi:ketosteroid isomerase-like protein